MLTLQRDVDEQSCLRDCRSLVQAVIEYRSCGHCGVSIAASATSEKTTSCMWTRSGGARAGGSRSRRSSRMTRRPRDISSLDAERCQLPLAPGALTAAGCRSGVRTWASWSASESRTGGAWEPRSHRSRGYDASDALPCLGRVTHPLPSPSSTRPDNDCSRLPRYPSSVPSTVYICAAVDNTGVASVPKDPRPLRQACALYRCTRRPASI